MSHSDYAYVVHGIVRKNSATLGLLQEIVKEGMKRGGEAHLHHGDVTDSQFMD
jgi:GDP-D-mannose dehydratase